MVESLSVIFPMFNEKEYVGKAVAQASRFLDSIALDYEIIIVDDASDDGSEEIARSLARTDPRVVVIRHEKNRKLGGCLKSGFARARKQAVLYSDIDLPFDFNEITKAIAVMEREQADIVSAFRNNRMADGIKRYWYSAVYNAFIFLLFGLRVRDVNFSCKLIRTALLKEISLFSEGSFINAELFVKTARKKAKIAQFDTMYFPRVHGFSRLSSLSVIAKIIQEALAFRFGFHR